MRTPIFAALPSAGRPTTRRLARALALPLVLGLGACASYGPAAPTPQADGTLEWTQEAGLCLGVVADPVCMEHKVVAAVREKAQNYCAGQANTPKLQEIAVNTGQGWVGGNASSLYEHGGATVSVRYRFRCSA